MYIQKATFTTSYGVKIQATRYDRNLMSPDYYEVECGGKEKLFHASEKGEIGKWIIATWLEQTIPMPARVYADIDWDSDHILTAVYEYMGKEK